MESGNSYDFVLVVNQPTTAEESEGKLMKLTSGYDLLAGKAENVVVPVSVTTQTVNVSINGGGATNGELPHLCSALNVEVSANQDMIDGVGNGNLSLGLVSMTIKKVAGAASLDMSQETLALASTTSASANLQVRNAEGTVENVNSASQVLKYDGGFMLPMALAAGESKNKVDMDFVMNVEGKEKTISLSDVEVPAFKPGYRYTIHLTVNGSIANLTTSAVNAWEEKSWESSMGGTNLGTGMNN